MRTFSRSTFCTFCSPLRVDAASSAKKSARLPPDRPLPPGVDGLEPFSVSALSVTISGCESTSFQASSYISRSMSHFNLSARSVRIANTQSYGLWMKSFNPGDIRLGCAATSAETFFCGVIDTPAWRMKVAMILRLHQSYCATSTEAPEEKSRFAYLPPAASHIPSSAAFALDSGGSSFQRWEAEECIEWRDGSLVHSRFRTSILEGRIKLPTAVPSTVTSRTCGSRPVCRCLGFLLPEEPLVDLIGSLVAGSDCRRRPLSGKLSIARRDGV